MAMKCREWVKIGAGFFQSPEIKYLEGMENGTEFILFYLKILLESLETGGELRFTKEIPYRYNTLAIITKTEISIVRDASVELIKLGLMKILDDGTIVVRKLPSSFRDRNDPRYAEWRKSVFLRDKYTCQMCGAVGGELNAHHIKPWASFPNSRFDTDNGITLCKSFHKEIHKKIGR